MAKRNNRIDTEVISLAVEYAHKEGVVIIYRPLFGFETAIR